MFYLKLKTGTIIFIIISLAITVTTCGIFAYLSDTDSVTNSLSIGDNNTEITEIFTPPDNINPGDIIKKEVAVKNNGSMPCFVRVALLVSNKDMSNNITLNLDTTNWELKPDGYYYYKKILPVGSTTEKLLSSVSISSSINTSDIEDFNITIYSESIQQGKNTSYTDAWQAFTN